MKHALLALAALFISAGLSAYGVSPDRATGANGAPANTQTFRVDPNGGPLQPMPQPGNNLMPGQQPPPPMPTQDIHKAIREYVPAEWAKKWGHVHLDDAKKLHTDPTVLFADARAKVEYDQGHIPGSIPMPPGEFDVYFKKYQSRIKAAKRIITYCHGVSCALSDKLAQKFYEEKKMHNVASFFGGWPQWSEAGLPVEVGPEPKPR